MNPSASANIMIIGEDTHFCYLFRSYLHRSNHQAMFAHPDDSVIETATQMRPAAIIIDVDLPGLSGWPLLRAFKTCQSTKDIPILICSWMDEKERGAKEGASLYLRMPVLYKDFLEALQSIGIFSSMKSE